jgi:hemolysin III
MRPLIRGHIHLAAFFVAIGAVILLITKSHGTRALTATIIYSLSLILLYGVSALYHCHLWSRPKYLLIRRIDHAAIFALIAGSATPICLLGLKNGSGLKLFSILWVLAIIGMLIAIFWTHAPKWVRAILYVTIGWAALPYLAEIESAIGLKEMWLLMLGGIVYTIGAVIYACKRPDPFPSVFGYHELFHTMVVIASALQFSVIYSLAT